MRWGYRTTVLQVVQDLHFSLFFMSLTMLLSLLSHCHFVVTSFFCPALLCLLLFVLKLVLVLLHYLSVVGLPLLDCNVDLMNICHVTGIKS